MLRRLGSLAWRQGKGTMSCFVLANLATRVVPTAVAEVIYLVHSANPEFFP